MRSPRTALFCVAVLCVAALSAGIHAQASSPLSEKVSYMKLAEGESAEGGAAMSPYMEASGAGRSSAVFSSLVAAVAESPFVAAITDLPAVLATQIDFFTNIIPAVQQAARDVFCVVRECPPTHGAQAGEDTSAFTLIRESETVNPTQGLSATPEPFVQEDSVLSPLRLSPSSPVVEQHTPLEAVPLTAQTTQPVIERVVERVVSGVDEGTLTSRLDALRAELLGRISKVSTPAVSAPSPSISLAGFAASQKIDKLDAVTITNPTITGGSVAAASISGTI